MEITLWIGLLLLTLIVCIMIIVDKRVDEAEKKLQNDNFQKQYEKKLDKDLKEFKKRVYNLK